MKREFPLFITAAIGLLMILSFFVPHQVVSVPADYFQACVIIVLAFSYFLGGANLIRVNVDAVYKREPGWPYKLVLVVALVATIVMMQGTMFSLLAFFIASAAFRAFRIRTLEAGLLAAAALIVMLGRVPLGNVLTDWFFQLRWLPFDGVPHGLHLSTIQDWIMNVPQNAAKRAILIGAALGVMATGLRVILGIERSYLSGED